MPSCRIPRERTRTRLISISRTPPAAKSRFIFLQRDVHTHVNNLYLYNVYKHIYIYTYDTSYIYILYNIVAGMMCSATEWRWKMTTCEMRPAMIVVFVHRPSDGDNIIWRRRLFGAFWSIDNIIITHIATRLETYSTYILFSGTWNFESTVTYKLY